MSMVSAQNECSEAMDITGMSDLCETIELNQITFDIVNGSCGNPSSSPNVWYKFTAEGKDLKVTVTSQAGQTSSINLIRFTTGVCDPVKFVEDTCTTNELDVQDFLEVGQEYYLEINFENTDDTIEFCFVQPDETPAPPNDLSCEAIHIFPNGNCIRGTTINAENDFQNLNCDAAEMQSVWYEFDLSEGDFFAAQITINNVSISGNVQVMLGTFENCDSNYVFVQKYCGAPEGVVIDFNQLEAGQKYYINVATLPEDQGEFDICVQEFETVTNSNPCTPTWIVPNEACESFDTYFSNFEYDISLCDYSNHTLWYAFDSGDNLKDIRFELDYIEGSEFIFMGIGLFDGNWCENSFVLKDSYCGPAQGASVYLDSIENFRPYYVVIGSTYGSTGKYSMCSDADFTDPFINDSPCLAYELDQVNYCVSGSNMFGKTSSEALCNFTVAKENWYKLETDQVGTSINVDLNSSSEKELKLQLGYFEDGCNDSFKVLKNYCGPSGDGLLNYTFPDTMAMAYLRVLTDTTSEVSFNLCINKSDYGYSCYQNDFCDDATTIDELFLNMERCFTACTFGATKENAQHDILGNYPTTWYDLKTSVAVDQLEFNVSSSTSLGVHFALFDECNNPLSVFESYEQITDEIDFHVKVEGDKHYYLAVTPIDEKGGKVDICAKGVIKGYCNKKDKLSVISTSMNSPLNGPFKNGEIINLCYEINEYNPMSEESCQWLQGIIPYFGDGWDISSFTFFAEPKVITDSLDPISVDVEWNWMNDVHSSINATNKYLTLRNADDQIDFCYGDNTECGGTQLSAGLPLPPGWYATNTKTGMHPDSTYGDGVYCNENNGPWKVCFDVKVGNVPNAILDVEFYTVSDGEIGEEENASDMCMNDQPLIKKFYTNCESSPTYNADTLSMCSTHTIDLGNEDGFTYKWLIKQNENVFGIQSGGGKKAQFNLENLSNELQWVTIFLKKYENNCLLEERDVTIKLFPQPNIPDIDPVTVCLFDQIAMNHIIDLDMHIIEDFNVDWQTDNLENTPDAVWKEDFDESFTMLVETASGCVHSDQVKIHVEDVYVGDILKPFTICKDEEVNMKKIIDLDFNINDEFTIDWFDDNIEDVSNATASFSESTKLYFKIVGEAGCTFSSNLDITVPAVPINILGDSIYCSNEEISLTAGYDYDLPHQRFWTTPTFDTVQFSGLVLPPGVLNGGEHVFTFDIITEEQCNFKAYDTIHIDVKPQLGFNQDTSELGICPYDSLLFTSVVVPSYYDIHWSKDGEMFDQGNSFYTNQAGQYIAQAGLSHCSTSDTFNLSLYPEVENNFSFKGRICTGDSTSIIPSKKDYFFSWSTGAKSSEIKVPGGDYNVVVSNDFNCIEEYFFTIKEQQTPEPEFTYKEVLCEGDSTMIVGSLDTLSYVWSTNEVGQEIQVGAGTYSVVFMDPLMCTDSSTITIAEEFYPVIDVNTSYMDSTLIIEGIHNDADTCYYLINDQIIPYQDSVTLDVPDNQLYKVSLFCANGDCFAVDTSSVFIPKIVFVSNTHQGSMYFYPNPARNTIHLYNEERIHWSRLHILNNRGVVVNRIENDHSFDGQIDIRDLTAGMYFFQLFMEEEIITRRIIIH